MKSYIVSIDQSTSASKVFLIDSQGGIVRKCSLRHHQSFPKPGYAEHDAAEIWQNVLKGIQNVTEGLAPEQLNAIAISNQRETTVFWDRETLEPVRPAIVWQDVRGAELCRTLDIHAQRVQEITGLALSPYYPAAKAAHALWENSSLMQAAREGRLCIGTVDSYLVNRLTAGRVFRTDVSNASRTQLFDLTKLRWSEEVCAVFDIPMACLPEVALSDGDFGTTACEGIPQGIVITGVLGDSHAALFGHGCLQAGMTKTSYGTGSSVMMNTGEKPVFSRLGLSTSIGFGFGGKISYVLEGNITHSGDTLVWLTEQAQMAADAAEVEAIAGTVPDTDGVYLVPAFSGMGAPHFDADARAALIGMNRGTTRAHIVRAALESMAYQNANVILTMEREMGQPVQRLHADGGGSRNPLLAQFQADLLACDVLCSSQSELSALGAAYMAGIRTGFFAGTEALEPKGTLYHPEMPEKERKEKLDGWNAAVKRCLS